MARWDVSRNGDSVGSVDAQLLRRTSGLLPKVFTLWRHSIEASKGNGSVRPRIVLTSANKERGARQAEID